MIVIFLSILFVFNAVPDVPGNTKKYTAPINISWCSEENHIRKGFFLNELPLNVETSRQNLVNPYSMFLLYA